MNKAVLSKDISVKDILNKDNRKLLLYLGLLYFSVLLNYKLPHTSYTISEYLIRPLKNNNSVFYPSSMLILLLMIIGLYGFINLERFKTKSKLLIFLSLVIFVLPFMKWTIDSVRTNYYWIRHEKLAAIDIEKSNISTAAREDKLTISVELKIKDYGKSANQFKFRVYLPATLAEYAGVSVLESHNYYITTGNRQSLNISESFDINLSKNAKQSGYYDSKWLYEEVKYELFNEDETLVILDCEY